MSPRLVERGGITMRGQAVLEFLIMIPFALVIILGAIQLTLIFNAHTMMKLAAFNAARAAIVAHGPKPEDPATVAEGLSAASTSAKLTLLPVIPAFHGLTASLASAQTLIANGVDANSLATGSPAVRGLFELGAAIRVEFLNRDDPTNAAAVGSWPNRIDFDDPNRPDDNVIKVRVTWDYPLVIPYINRILTAIARPDLYVADKLLTGQPVNADTFLDLALNRKPAWGYADFMSRPLTGNPEVDAAAAYLLLRWPMRATAVMRTQWDRKEN